MRWVDGECRLSDSLWANVFNVGREWRAEIYANNDWRVWRSEGYATEAAAKSAVAAWIGKTIAQFGNALAAGEPRPYEQDDGA